jgi:hypothetical protein
MTSVEFFSAASGALLLATKAPPKNDAAIINKNKKDIDRYFLIFYLI